MKTEGKLNAVKNFFVKIGKKNLIIAGAVLLIGTAVVLNFVLFNKSDKNAGHDYGANAGMSDIFGTAPGTQSTSGGDNTPTNTSKSDSYFSGVQVSRARVRDEALEVLNATLTNVNADETARSEALAEIKKLTDEMKLEANIESLVVSKGFDGCVAVLNGDRANIVVKCDDLIPAKLAQINAIVFEQAGIRPENISIANCK